MSQDASCPTDPRPARPSFWKIVSLFALVFVAFRLFSILGLKQPSFALGTAADLGAVFLIGLVAASSSCIAVTGGLLLSAAAKFNERYASSSRLDRFRPVFLFIVGRLGGYALFGGLLGLLGQAVSPPPIVTALITIVAAVYMLMMGLDMLGIAPLWLKRRLPHLPKFLAHRVFDAEGHEHPIMPFLLGAGTFFLPCGFTQAFQLYALTTGSFWNGAATLFAFALGTAPALFALGFASSSLKGKAGRFFFQFSGALVVVLGLWNMQNGLALAGYPLAFSSDVPAGPMSSVSGVTFDGRVQIIRMTVNPTGYTPNRFTIRAGVDTRWIIDGTNAAGCISVLQSRTLGIQKFLARGENTITFTTPSQPGVYPFSCSMGMYRGQIIVTL